MWVVVSQVSPPRRTRPGAPAIARGERDPSGAKVPDFICWLFGTTEEAAEKLGILGETGRKSLSVAKATVDSVGFMRGLKPPPPSELVIILNRSIL